MTPYNRIRLIMMFTGNLLIGFAISLLRLSNLGTDPFSTMNLAMSNLFGFQFGTYMIIVNVLLLLIVIIYARHFIGLGTIVNMVFIGYTSDLFVALFQTAGFESLLLPVRFALMFTALLVIGAGASLYMSSNMGLAPYDALAFIIQKAIKDKLPFVVIRIATDSICVLLGLSFGGIVGISTVATALCIGPLIQFFNNRFSVMLEKVKNKSTIVV